jgi:hypothetical protein
MDPNQQYNPYQQSGSVPGVSNGDHHRRTTAIIIAMSVLSVVLLGVSVWLFSMYSQQKNNVDQIAAERVEAAVEQHEAELTEEFETQQESNTTRFKGPSVYGSLNFAYPKQWSVYDNPDTGSSILYEVKIHPNAVGRGVSGEAIIARVLDETYDSVVSRYDSGIEDGSVKASSIKSNGQNGVRLSGVVGDDQDQTGVKVILPVRDRTITLTNLSQQHRDVFNSSIASLKFQP